MGDEWLSTSTQVWALEFVTMDFCLTLYISIPRAGEQGEFPSVDGILRPNGVGFCHCRGALRQHFPSWVGSISITCQREKEGILGNASGSLSKDNNRYQSARWHSKDTRRLYVTRALVKFDSPLAWKTLQGRLQSSFRVGAQCKEIGWDMPFSGSFSQIFVLACTM